jgi:hypothetical protein
MGGSTDSQKEGVRNMKHVLLINDDRLFREVEAAAIVKNVPVETMTEDLIRVGIAARESRETATRRPAAVWPPVRERRKHA